MRKKYTKLDFTLIELEIMSSILSGSVIEQNSIIKATSQEVNEADFGDSSQFDINWE